MGNGPLYAKWGVQGCTVSIKKCEFEKIDLKFDYNDFFTYKNFF